MKVVINHDFGGFSLSNEAVEACIENGLKLTQYNAEGNYENPDAHFVELKESLFRNQKYGCIEGYGQSQNKFRTNPILVEVVEKLKNKANGSYASLKVIDIPFNDNQINCWHIDEYDGAERICENYKSWSGHGPGVNNGNDF